MLEFIVRGKGVRVVSKMLILWIRSKKLLILLSFDLLRNTTGN